MSFLSRLLLRHVFVPQSRQELRKCKLVKTYRIDTQPVSCNHRSHYLFGRDCIKLCGVKVEPYRSLADFGPYNMASPSDVVLKKAVASLHILQKLHDILTLDLLDCFNEIEQVLVNELRIWIDTL